MMKSLLLLVVLASTMLASTHAFFEAKQRLIGRVIHFESNLKRGRWLMDSGESAGNLYIDEMPKDDIYFEPKVQFKVKDCKSFFICFESLSRKNYYLAAVQGKDNKPGVKLVRSVHPESDQDRQFLWKVFCDSDALKRCRVSCGRQFGPATTYYLAADNRGKFTGSGHYDATLDKVKDMDKVYFTIAAPNPTDSYVEIFSTENGGSSPQKATYKASVGVSTTQSSSHTLTTSASVEIGAAFKVFSATASASIESSWEHTSESTFQKTKEISHEVTIAPKTKIVLKQLIGKYADMFKVGADKYKIEEEKITKRSYFFHPRARHYLWEE